MNTRVVAIVGGIVVLCGLGSFALRGMGGGPKKEAAATYTVARNDLNVTAVENGLVDAIKTVEVKGRVDGRLAKLLVDEGDYVQAGQLIAEIDPLETKLKLEQNSAQLMGAESNEARAKLERIQKMELNRAALSQAESKARQLLLELKSQPVATKALIAEAQATLFTAVEEKNRLVKSAHPSQRASTQTALDEAKANLKNSEAEFNRQKELLADGYTSRRSVESAQLNIELAKTRLASAEVNQQRLDAQLAVELAKADAQIRQAQASLNRAKANANQDAIKVEDYRSALAEVARAKANLMDTEILAKSTENSAATVAQLSSIVQDSRRQLSETEVRAPISGIVTKKGLQVGELATGLSSFSSGTTIVKIEDRSAMRVKLNMNEIDTANLKVGLPATITVDALPDQPMKGIVTRIAAASVDANKDSSATNTGAVSTDAVVKYEVEVKISSPSAKLRTGMSAKCTIPLSDKRSVVSVPVDYIKRKEGKTFVLLPRKGEPAEEREVELGSASGTLVEVKTGLGEGDIIEKPAYEGPSRKGFVGGGSGD